MAETKKRIGIVTFSLSNNAGAMLQLLSLYHFLEKDYDVQIINYDNPNTYRGQYPRFILKKVFKHPTFLFNSHLLYYLIGHHKYKRFRKSFTFSKKMKRKSDTVLKERYYAIIYGSDQILNLTLTNFDFFYGGGLERVLADKKIMFSGSLGWYNPQTNQEKDFLYRCLSNFNFKSIREKQTCDSINNTFKLDIKNTCDPTLLNGLDYWKTFINSTAKRKFKRKYIFLYYANKEIWEKGLRYAQNHDCLIYYSYPQIEIKGSKSICRVNDDPISFLNFIYYADYVMTSSFHCLTFSLIFNKKCFVPFDMNNKVFIRLFNLVNGFDLKFFTTINEEAIDYRFYEQKKDIIDYSINFIKDSLNAK